MKHYLNANNPDLIQHNQARLAKKHRRTSVYNESERPLNSTRVWISYDIEDDKAPKDCRNNLESWLGTQQAESFGKSVATFLIKDKCIRLNSKLADWLLNELKGACVLNKDDGYTNDKPYLTTPGISLYVIYRSRTFGPTKATNQFSNHFVLIHNAPLGKVGGY